MLKSYITGDLEVVCPVGKIFLKGNGGTKYLRLLLPPCHLVGESCRCAANNPTVSFAGMIIRVEATGLSQQTEGILQTAIEAFSMRQR